MGGAVSEPRRILYAFINLNGSRNPREYIRHICGIIRIRAVYFCVFVRHIHFAIIQTGEIKFS